MAFTVKYYRLFEVRLLHEYYLLEGNQHTYFDLLAADRQSLLKERLLTGQYPLGKDLAIAPSAECQKALDNYRLKFAATTTGFVVAASGVMKTLSGGTQILAPEISLPTDLELAFRLQVKNGLFKNFTSLPLKTRFPGSYYFSNDPNAVHGVGFATLSQEAPPFSAGTDYAAGDLAFFGAALQEAVANTNSGSHWQSVESDGYANESDRILLPKTFVFPSKPGTAGGTFTFVLKKTTGETVKTITVSSNKPESGIRLDFSRFKPSGYPDEVFLADGLYNLEITTPTGTETRRVYLFSQHNPGDLGLVSIRAGVTDANYRILGADGEILQFPPPQSPHRVFEIRLRSRRTFWRYQARLSEKKLSLQEADTASLFVDGQGNNAAVNSPVVKLVTKAPQKLTRLPLKVSDGGGVTFIVLPQPPPTPLLVNSTLLPGEPPGRLFSEVYVSAVASQINIVN